MGNRAVITTKEKNVGIYVHWNGGRASVEAFLRYGKERGFRLPEVDNYGWARLTVVVGNFFGGDHSLGIDTCNNLDMDNGDNGVYIIENWEIIGREYFPGEEDNDYDLYEMLKGIDEAQPEKDQLWQGKRAEEIKELLTRDEGEEE